MLSNRRSVKLLQDFEALNASERSPTLSSVFQDVLNRQEKKVNSVIASHDKSPLPPEYYARRFGITWILFAIAEFGNAKELEHQLKQLDAVRKRIVSKCESNGNIQKGIIEYLCRDPFPDEVAILNIMLHHILKKKYVPDAIAGLNRSFLPLVKFDAPANTFDLYKVPTEESYLPSCISKQEVWKEISVFRWEYALSQPENMDAVFKNKAEPSFKHQKARLDYVRSILTRLAQ